MTHHCCIDSDSEWRNAASIHHFQREAATKNRGMWLLLKIFLYCITMLYNILQSYLPMQVAEGVIVTVQEKAWMDEKLMLVYLQEIWRPYVDWVTEEVGLPGTISLLVMDSFRAHTTEAVKDTLEEMNTTAPIIPGGCTSKVQPLDVCVNKPFKQLLKASWAQYLKRVFFSQDGGKVKTATRQEITDWIVRAWQATKVKRELIQKSFQVCALIESSPSMDDIVRQALDKVQNELLQNVEDFDCEDPVADIVPEQDVDAQDSTSLVIAEAD